MSDTPSSEPFLVVVTFSKTFKNKEILVILLIWRKLERM